MVCNCSWWLLMDNNGQSGSLIHIMDIKHQQLGLSSELLDINICLHRHAKMRITFKRETTNVQAGSTSGRRDCVSLQRSTHRMFKKTCSCEPNPSNREFAEDGLIKILNRSTCLQRYGYCERALKGNVAGPQNHGMKQIITTTISAIWTIYAPTER